MYAFIYLAFMNASMKSLTSFNNIDISLNLFNTQPWRIYLLIPLTENMS